LYFQRRANFKDFKKDSRNRIICFKWKFWWSWFLIWLLSCSFKADFENISAARIVNFYLSTSANNLIYRLKYHFLFYLMSRKIDLCSKCFKYFHFINEITPVYILRSWGDTEIGRASCRERV
jgi:hypothetical protein